MDTPINRIEPTQISNADVESFVAHSVLLSLIDPVRGKPTRTSLHEDPNGISGGLHLKQRFLDSFALVSSTLSSGAQTASAVCLEQYTSAGNILRVARNNGFTPKVLEDLERLLQILRTVAKKEMSLKQAESEILRLVADLDKERVLSMAEKISKGWMQSFSRETGSEPLTDKMKTGTWTNSEFKRWLQSCPYATTSTQATPETRVKLINWASKARWDYPEQLQNVFGHDHAQKPPWLNSLHKMARYHSATKSMIKLAAKNPEVFLDIRILEVENTYLRSFSFAGKRSRLLHAVKDLVQKDPATTMESFEKHLGAQGVEKRLRKACQLDLTLHAEMQLVVFYEGNRDLAPRLQFIGTSKKACFLCNKYLLQHPLQLQASACHQKIYPTWMPPPYYPTSQQFKGSLPFRKFSKTVEQLTGKDLRTALNAPRRPKNQYSTAGPSLTRMTTTIHGGNMSELLD